MRTVKHQFDTRAEALGFIAGVEWVNDSAVEIVDIELGPNDSFVVVTTDEDGEGDALIVYIPNGDGTYTEERT